MKGRVTTAVRWVAGLTLLILSVRAFQHGYLLERLLAAVEGVASVAFCLPRVWRIGAYGLLAVLAVAFTHHAIQGAPSPFLLFAMLVVILELTHERP